MPLKAKGFFRLGNKSREQGPEVRCRGQGTSLVAATKPGKGLSVDSPTLPPSQNLARIAKIDRRGGGSNAAPIAVGAASNRRQYVLRSIASAGMLFMRICTGGALVGVSTPGRLPMLKAPTTQNINLQE